MKGLQKTCLICKSDLLKKLSGYYEKHGLVKCKSCGFVFMERIPSESELMKYYDTSYSYSSDDKYYSPITKKNYQLLLDEFEPYRNNNKILDVGCGRGWFLIEARDRGWQVYGTEFSEKAKQLCKGKGLNVKLGKLNSDKFALDEFDVITSFEVIEHINNPLEEMEYINNFLRPGGLFYCTTPNFNSLLRYYLKDDYNIINYPEHLSYYTRKTLNKLAIEKGFEPIKCLSTGFSVTRFKTSKNISKEDYISKESSDEQLRQNIEKKWYLRIAKYAINYIFTLFNLGMTLKGYYIKKE